MQGINHARKQPRSIAVIPEEGNLEEEGLEDTSIITTISSELPPTSEPAPQHPHPSENAGTNLDHQTSSQTDLASPLAFYASSLAAGECGSMIMGEDMMGAHHHYHHQAPAPGSEEVPAWMGMMANLAQEHHANRLQGPQPTSAPLSPPLQNCSCSPAAGPCPGHLEKMRLELLEEMTASSPLQLPHADNQQQQQQPQQPHDLGTSHRFVGRNNMASSVLTQQLSSHLGNYSPSSSRWVIICRLGSLLLPASFLLSIDHNDKQQKLSFERKSRPPPWASQSAYVYIFSLV